jgi:hypothetical protein
MSWDKGWKGAVYGNNSDFICHQIVVTIDDAILRSRLINDTPRCSVESYSTFHVERR